MQKKYKVIGFIYFIIVGYIILFSHYLSRITTALEYVKCGSVVGIPKPIPQLITISYTLIITATPIILIIFGIIDLVKALFHGNADESVKVKGKLIKKLIVVAIIFLISSIVQFVISRVTSNDTDKTSMTQCLKCFLYFNGNDCLTSESGNAVKTDSYRKTYSNLAMSTSGNRDDGDDSTSSASSASNYRAAASIAPEKILSEAIDWAVKIANDNSHGYSNVPGNQLGQNGEYNCIGLVTGALKAGGLNPYDNGVYGINKMAEKFISDYGFEDVTSEVNLSTGQGLKKGDVLWLYNSSQGHGHTEMYIGNNKLVGARADYDGVKGDSSGNEILVASYSNMGWQKVLRYTGAGEIDGKTGSTNAKVIKLNRTYATIASVANVVSRGKTYANNYVKLSATGTGSDEVVWQVVEGIDNVTINQKGEVRGKYGGEAIVRATSKSNPSAFAECKIYIVHSLFEDVKINQTVVVQTLTTKEKVTLKKGTKVVLLGFLARRRRNLANVTFKIRLKDGQVASINGKYLTFVSYHIDDKLTNAQYSDYINSNGFTSQTKYLFWVNQGTMRILMFERKGNKWSLIENFPTSTGDTEGYYHSASDLGGGTGIKFNLEVKDFEAESANPSIGRAMHVRYEDTKKYYGNTFHIGPVSTTGKNVPRSHGCPMLTVAHRNKLYNTYNQGSKNVLINSKVIYY